MATITKSYENQLLNQFFTRKNGTSEIERIVSSIIKSYGLPQSEDDDFFSLAGEVFFQALGSYDSRKNGNFRPYLIMCLTNRITDVIRAKNRVKRTADRRAVSIDTPIDSADGDITIGDMISDPAGSAEEIVLAGIRSETVDRYMDELTGKQRKVAVLIMDGCTEAEIMAEMHMSYREYNRTLDAMRSFEVSSLLLA